MPHKYSTFVQIFLLRIYLILEGLNELISLVIMKTVTVEIKNDIALAFLQNLESMHILKVIENKAAPATQKLSERFAGCLSKERAEELQKELTKMRNEWERDTY